MTKPKPLPHDKVGRPTSYRPEYAEQVIQVCAEGYSLTGFAGRIGVARSSINEWAEKHPEFSDAVNRAKAKRAQFWEARALEVAQTGGTGGQSTMIIFGLKNHAPEDFADRQQHEHTGKDGAPLVPVLNVVLSNGKPSGD